jgi:sterol desaturase/sphingolipid hydroxylase (fatty acid hydroxylase superfamily)
VLDIIPSLLLLWIISLAMKLIRSLKENPYEENTVTLAEMLGALCKNVVITISILIVITNVIQILFSPLLLSSQYQIYLPVYELLIVFIILLLSRKLSENRMLKLDNDSFI